MSAVLKSGAVGITKLVALIISKSAIDPNLLKLDCSEVIG